MNRPTPVRVPPEPTPTTTASMSPPICSKISGRGRGLVGQRVGRVLELVDVDRSRDRLGQGLGHVLVVFRMALADVAAGQAHVHAHGPQVQDLFPRHLVRHDQDQLVALQRRHLGQAEAGIAGRRLDDRAARLEAAVGLGRLDHRARHAVLDRAPGVLVLQLQEQPARPGVEVATSSIGVLPIRSIAEFTTGGKPDFRSNMTKNRSLKEFSFLYIRPLRDQQTRFRDTAFSLAPRALPFATMANALRRIVIVKNQSSPKLSDSFPLVAV
jgi:hypothetical protein